MTPLCSRRYCGDIEYPTAPAGISITSNVFAIIGDAPAKPDSRAWLRLNDAGLLSPAFMAMNSLGIFND